MKIALFGGSFDPLHLGHLIIADQAHVQCRLDQVLFIPCRKSPHKPGSRPVSGEERLAMIQSATRHLPWARVTSMEIKRKGLSYTFETVKALKAKYGESRLYWILGSDQWEVLETWREFSYLREILEFIVYPRPGSPNPKKGVTAQFIDKRIDISSSEIRKRVARNLPISMYVPSSVERRIQMRGLYRASRHKSSSE